MNKKILLLLIGWLVALGSIQAQDWTQIGADIDGEAYGDRSGQSVSLSSDGLVVAIGAPYNDGNGENVGHVRVYQYDGSAWIQLGDDIDGEAEFDYFGYSVSLSSDGSIVAIGAINNDGNGEDVGHVRVYQYNGSAWIQLGDDIDGEAEEDRSGYSVSLSSDGSVVAIGAGNNDGNGSYAGHVRVYQYNGTEWIQLGADIDGEAIGDISGNSVSLSSDGLIVAIGASGNDATGSLSGHVRVFEYDGSEWIQIGADIDGEAESDRSGWSVSLSSDGSIVAIGAYRNDGSGSDAGHVRVYQYNGVEWIQMGTDIDGEAAGDRSGNSVSLSADGSIVAIGAYLNDGNGTDAGHVRVYEYNGTEWIHIGADIDGEAALDNSGCSVSLSSNGTKIAIGANLNKELAYFAGHVRVYEFTPPPPPMELVFTTTDVNQIIKLPLYGSVNCTVDWGDATATEDFSTEGLKEHTFATAGTYNVTITGELTQFGNGSSWSGHDYLIEVVSFGETGLTSLNGAFRGVDNLTSVPAELPASVTDLSNAFKSTSLSSITNLDLWNVSNVTNMSYMFNNATSFNQNIGSWNVGNVTNMKNMFENAASFNQDLNSWNVENVTDMSYMFLDAAAFNGNISSWNVGSVTTMSYMFCVATAFNSDISNWNVGSVTEMDGMFYVASSFNQNIGSWNVSNVTDMAYMFQDATSFNQNIGNWNVTNVSDMDDMFRNVTLSTANYDAILNAWSAKSLQSDVSFSGGNSQYSCNASDTKAILENNFNWYITDGGLEADATAPDTPTLPDLTGECSVTATSPTTTDNCAGTITGTTSDALTYTEQGTYTITWTFDDGNGNSIDVYQNVIVSDVTAPETPTLADLTGECSVTATAPTTTDNCAGTIEGTTSDPTEYTAQGTYTITWTFDDGVGNSIDVDQNVIVSDVTAPETPILADVTGECSATVSETPTTTDNCAGEITGTTSDELTYTEQGTYTVTWTFDDGNGNSIDVEQIVIVSDVTASETPTLSTLTDECSVTAVAPTTNDNCAGEITGTTSDALTYTEQGTYTITWTFDDGNGNISTAEQTVIVDDATAPIAPTLADVAGECSVTVTETPTTNDACVGEITGTTSDALTYTEQGTYTVTWSFDDGNGNISTAEQTVIVDDITDPTITCVANQTVDADNSNTYTVQGTEFDPTETSDNCEVASIENDFNNTATLEGATLSEGTTTIVWTVTDIAGNTTTCECDIIVNAFVGISNIAESNIVIYPNPTNGAFNIKNANGYNISIIDITGKKVFESEINNENYEISNQNLNNGVYIINLKSNDEVKSIKLIVE